MFALPFRYVNFIACGDEIHARFAARTSDFCFGKSHQNHFSPSSHPIPKRVALWYGVPCAPRPRRGLADRTSCPAANARLPGAPLSGLIRLALRCSARRKRGNVNTRTSKSPKALVLWFGCRPLSRTEHRGSARIRPDRGAPGRRALAAGQDVLSANPRLGREAQGPSRRRGGASLGTFLSRQESTPPAVREPQLKILRRRRYNIKEKN